MALSVWTAVAIPAFVIVTGLGVDFSGHTEAEQEARAVARQAARAATHQVALLASGPELDVGAAKRAATDFARAAGYEARVDIVDGMRAEVVISGSYRTLLLGIIGVDELDFTASASAVALTVIDGEPA